MARNYYRDGIVFFTYIGGVRCGTYDRRQYCGRTRTLSIAIYDSVLAFEHQQAQTMSLILLAISLITISIVYSFNRTRVLRF